MLLIVFQLKIQNNKNESKQIHTSTTFFEIIVGKKYQPNIDPAIARTIPIMPDTKLQ